MRPDNSLREQCLIPFLFFGYIETLRRATFQSIGMVSQGYTFSVLTIFIITIVSLRFYCSRKRVSIIGSLITLAYIFAVIYANYFGKSNAISSWFIFSMPAFSGGETIGSKQLLFFFIFVFYAVLIYLIIHTVFDQKSVTEINAASFILLMIEIGVTQKKLDLSIHIIPHIIFMLLLRSQIFHLYLISKNKSIEIKNNRGKGRRWVGLNLLVVFLITILAFHMPTRGTIIDLVEKPVKWAKGELVKKAEQITGHFSGETQFSKDDTFHMKWGKLNKFNIEGPVTVSDNPVMSVKSPRPFYWRGEIADYYTGSGWVNSFDLNSPTDSSISLPNPYGQGITIEKVEQNFSLSPKMSSTVIFTAGDPEYIDTPYRFYWTDNNGNFYSKELRGGTNYIVTSYIPEFNYKQLREAKVNYDAGNLRPYRQLPDDLPAKVREKALEVTRGLDNTYDKVKAIEQYLAGNFPYTTEMVPPPENRDIVEYFLFDLKEGYCTYHSTAMIVMLRFIGIPSRWVKGFTPGTFNEETGVFLVKEKDAHAWVEVYFGKFGWVPFEPTSGFVLPATQQQFVRKDKEVAAEIKESVPVYDNQTESKPEIQVGRDSLAVNRIFIILVIITTGWVFWNWRKLKISLQNIETSKVTYNYLDLISRLEKKGFVRSHDQTPYEYAKYLGELFPDIYNEIILLTEGYLQERYGQYKIDKSRYNNLTTAWEKIISELKEKRNS